MELNLTTRSITGEDSRERLEAVRARFADWQVDGLLINSPANRRWLSGFTGSAGWLLVTADQALLATDFRYWEQASRQSPHFTLYRQQRTSHSFEAFVRQGNVTVIGVEAGHMTVAQFGRLQEISGIEWVALDETLESLREVKSTRELATIRAAAAVTDLVMGQVNQLARPGLSEAALAWELEKRMREAGATTMAFDVIVASGPNAALAHHRPGERQLQAGDSLVVDMGAAIDGLHSDLTRTFFLGDQADDHFSEIYHLVLQAQTRALDGMRAGMTGQAIDTLARDVISNAGYGEQFGHGLGHGVGLEIHERPRLSPQAHNEIIRPGVTVTVEPGIYLPEWGGVRIEDFVVVTETGIERLSHCPKEPLIPTGGDGWRPTVD